MEKLPLGKPLPPTKKGYELNFQKSGFRQVPKKPKWKKKQTMDEHTLISKNKESDFSLKLVKKMMN